MIRGDRKHEQEYYGMDLQIQADYKRKKSRNVIAGFIKSRDEKARMTGRGLNKSRIQKAGITGDGPF